MKSLKLIEQIEQIMFECGNREIAQKAFEFYMELYGSRENTKEEIEKLLETLLKKLSEVHTKGEWGKVETLLNLI
jgi:FKBP-type peptidyl-prolyl cis-trans isomerase 2